MAGDADQPDGILRYSEEYEWRGITLGQHLLTHWSRTQTCVALSSGEAELNAMFKAASEGLCLQYLINEVCRRGCICEEIHRLHMGLCSALGQGE